MSKLYKLFLLGIMLCSCNDPYSSSRTYPTRVVEDNGHYVQPQYTPQVQPVPVIVQQRPSVFPLWTPTPTIVVNKPQPAPVVVKQKITVIKQSPTPPPSSVTRQSSTKKSYVFSSNKKKKR